jgi:hypothetical protein
MAKWILAFVGVVVLAAGTAAYVAMNGTPPVPTGACPALISSAPYDANVVMYADLSSLRSTDISRQLEAIESAPQAAPFRDFVEKTNFHFERDLDHILLTASANSNAGALVLEGRFDQPKIAVYAAQFGKMNHYEAGDMFDFHNPGMQGTISMMFLNPSRLAFAGGPGSETQILVLADASKGSEPSLTDDLCARVQRVAGAPFFVVGDIPKVVAPMLTNLAARNNTSAVKVLQSLRGWDAAYWMDGDSFRIAIEAEFDSRYDALQARINLDKLRDSIRNYEATSKAAPKATGSGAQVADAFTKNLAFSLDGRYVRLGTSVKKADLEKMVADSVIPPTKR